VIVALHRPSPQANPVEGIVRIAENVTADFYGPGAEASMPGKSFDPDEIGYQAGENVATLIREATIKRGGR
jgi:hypothetical protein